MYLDDCVCVLPDLTTPPWCREKVMVYYYLSEQHERQSAERVCSQHGPAAAEFTRWSWSVLLSYKQSLRSHETRNIVTFFVKFIKAICSTISILFNNLCIICMFSLISFSEIIRL